MSIEDHKWYMQSDIDECRINHTGNIFIIMTDDTVILNKSDAIAIAKHFEVDNESLINKIKALIEDYCEYDNEACNNFMVKGLQNLINDTKEN